jgi:hypothetical protein
VIPNGWREGRYEYQKRGKKAVAELVCLCNHFLESGKIVGDNESGLHEVFDATVQPGINDRFSNNQQRQTYQESDSSGKVKEKGNFDLGIESTVLNER